MEDGLSRHLVELAFKPSRMAAYYSIIRSNRLLLYHTRLGTSAYIFYGPGPSP